MAGKESVTSADLTGDGAYRLLTSIIVPRPIAWVSTVSPDGIRNLAPHSYFNGVSSSPPLVMFSADLTGDTAANIRSNGEFVVNTVSVALAEAMETTASAVGAPVDEFALAGLTPVAATDVQPPLIDESPASLECVVREARPFGDSLMVVGEVVRFHFAPGLMGDTGRLEPERLDPLGRLGKAYAPLGEVFRQDRPTPEALGVSGRPERAARRAVGRAHLVGSVPRDTAAEVMELCVEHLVTHLAAIPDGVTGVRLDWTT
ncbi:MAG: flavin reductase family protein, partial [Acidimicrobiaceae bacterium]|nr:flavin reductase family protein [Acidimicrobiaceae bacterium]